MDLNSLRKPELIRICEELGVDIRGLKRKPIIIKAILDFGTDEAELSECWEEVQRIDKEKRELEEQERSDRLKSQEAELKLQEAELKRQEQELEMKRLELELVKSRGDREGSPASSTGEGKSFKMKNLMQPFKIGEDVGLFLVNFERTCEKVGFARQTWPQRLLTLLPCPAADVVARLTKDEAEDYEKVKTSLLRKYRLSAEAFRQRFRSAEKKPNESFPEFAYNLRANLVEWLKFVDAHGDHDKVVECICLEQFLRRIPEETRLWVQDKPDARAVQRAAELAEEFATRRALDEKGHPRKEKAFPPGKRDDGRWPGGRFSRDGRPKRVEGENRKEPARTKGEAGDGTDGRVDHEKKKSFEARRPLTCYNCQKPGHVAAGCREPKVVFAYVNDGEENLRLLEPYLRDLTVNGRQCRVLRDSAATMDVIHPSYVDSTKYTGECAWIKQVVEEHSVCLPVARVRIEGPFGALETEAAVSANLPLGYPYLFSNRSEELLRERGQTFCEGTVLALTRAKARDLAAKLEYGNEADVPTGRTPLSNASRSAVRGDVGAADPERRKEQETPVEKTSEGKAQKCLDMEGSEGLCVTPESGELQKLLGVDRDSLIAQQEADPTIKDLRSRTEEGVSRRNVAFQKRKGVWYRKYKDRKGIEFDQLVVPAKYRRDLIHLAHGNSWSGHLGVRKTKDRLLQEFYWPGCFKEVEEVVRSCDTCQRIGKPHDKTKAPLKLVPIITEPFRRLVIDTVGPLPVTQSGYRHILTILCPATKFPEAIPLKELSSVEVVNALLSVFARVGFPAEIQSDQGSVFTSALTTTFLERCGIKLIHSSVYHPQSNSVEKWHSVMKRVLRALCYEHKTDWEACLPATMFALRSVPHEATGFSPAELVYGRSLRSPLQMLRESWEGHGEDPTVVEYVLELLDRLNRSRSIAESNMKDAQVKAKRYYDQTAKPRTFSVGDKVMLLRPSTKNKLEVQWEGPVEVLHKLSDVNYVVSTPGKRKIQKVYHSNLMKPYRQRETVMSLTVNHPEEVSLEFPEISETPIACSVEQVLEKAVVSADLEPRQLGDLKALLGEFIDQFQSKPGITDLVVHDIELTTDQPVRSKPYRVSPRQREIMEREVKRMLDLGVIEAGESDYTSPLILVEVPGKEPRPCVDYRRLNLITKDQTYPIPNIEERVEMVSAAKYISTLDLVRGYWQVPLSERASRYAAFISPFGTFRPRVLSFGLKNAPFCFFKLNGSGAPRSRGVCRSVLGRHRRVFRVLGRTSCTSSGCFRTTPRRGPHRKGGKVSIGKGRSNVLGTRGGSRLPPTVRGKACSHRGVSSTAHKNRH
ncbi:uncharacterized protein LOC115316745 [Ixodes scapularis]|uniref:uncharacterized protein LOC115316745 n=1 Tax=Ixodes scapularis TaxID=6945 RepID=UPI001C380AE1|nr:uncharacterized protein LOC115316745 [Ixodes scapularis]